MSLHICTGLLEPSSTSLLANVANSVPLVQAANTLVRLHICIGSHTPCSHKNIGFFANHKATKPAFNVGPSSARQ